MPNERDLELPEWIVKINHLLENNTINLYMAVCKLWLTTNIKYE